MKRRLLLVMSFGLLAACDEMVGPGPGTPGSNAAPTVDLTADVTEGNAPLAVNFTVAASDPDGDTLEYTLNFGDGESVSAQSAAHTYRAAGSYVASVTVNDGQGGSANDSVTIEVAEDGGDDGGGDGGDDGDDGGSGGSGGDDGDAEACTNPVEILDEVLEDAVRFTLGKRSGNLTCADLASLTELRYSPDSGGDGTEPESPIRNLSGLEYATSLRELSLNENAITDVAPLRNLTKLEQLYLRVNDVQTVEPLSKLVNLRKLEVTDNKISEITSLANLTKLELLALGENQIRDLSALKNLENLKTLVLDSIATNDLRPLQNLSKLEGLSISFNEVSDLTLLSNLTQLKFLAAADNTFTTLSGLQSLINLQQLTLDRNTLSDISQLKFLVNLERLGLSETGISDIASLQPLIKLELLDLSNNRISDITPLVNNPGIGYIDSVRIVDNDLDTCPGSQDLADIQALEAREVTVVYDACNQ